MFDGSFSLVLELRTHLAVIIPLLAQFVKVRHHRGLEISDGLLKDTRIKTADRIVHVVSKSVGWRQAVSDSFLSNDLVLLPR